MKALFISLLFCASASFAKDHHHHHEHHEAMEAKPATAVRTDSFYNLQGLWRDMAGNKFDLKSLRGRPVILAMAYTKCKVSCPVLVARLKEIETALEKSGVSDFSMVVASLDPVGDTPTRLAEYSGKQKLNTKHWILLSPGSDKDVRELAAANGTVYSRDKDGEYSHSNIISLLDSEGVIQKQLSGLTAEYYEFVESAAKLAHAK